MRPTLAAAFALAITLPAAAAQQQHSIPPHKPAPPVTAPSKLQPSAEDSQQQHAPENRGTEQVPFVVKVIPSERSQEAEKHDAQKAEIDRQTVEFTRDLAGYTNRLFWATVALAAFTAGLSGAAFLQMRDTRRTIKAAETAAKAAERHATVAEQTFVDLERPYLFYERIRMEQPITSGWLDPNIEIGNRIISVLYEIKNYGRTPAVIIERANSVYIGQTLSKRPLHNENDIWNDEYVLGTSTPNDMHTFSAFYRGNVDLQLIGDLYLTRSGGTGNEFFFFAYVKYNTVSGITDEVGVCYEYLIDIGQFVQRSREHYTYRKRGEQPAPPQGSPSLT
jgi:hypothetical protein